MSRFEQRRAAKLRQLGEGGPLVAASLGRAARRCGKATCRCARGQPHWAWVLTFKVRGKSHTVHVPKELVPEVRQWVQQYRRAKQLIGEISRLSLAIIHRHVPARRAAARATNRPAR